MEAPKRAPNHAEYFELEDLVWESEVRPKKENGSRFDGVAKGAYLRIFRKWAGCKFALIDVTRIRVAALVGAADAASGKRVLETLAEVGLIKFRGEPVKGRYTIELLDPRDVLIGRRQASDGQGELFEARELEEESTDPTSSPAALRIGGRAPAPSGDTAPRLPIPEPAEAPALQQPAEAPALQQPAGAPALQQPAGAPALQQPPIAKNAANARNGPAGAPALQQAAGAPALQQPAGAPALQQPPIAKNAANARNGPAGAPALQQPPPPRAWGGELPREDDLQVLDLDLYVDPFKDLRLVGKQPRISPFGRDPEQEQVQDLRGGSASASAEGPMAALLASVLDSIVLCAQRSRLERVQALVGLVPGLWPDFADVVIGELLGDHDAAHGGEPSPLVDRELARLVSETRAKHEAGQARKGAGVYFSGSINTFLSERGRKRLWVAPAKPKPR